MNAGLFQEPCRPLSEAHSHNVFIDALVCGSVKIFMLPNLKDCKDPSRHVPQNISSKHNSEFLFPRGNSRICS